MKPNISICREITAILRKHGTTVEKLSANYRRTSKKPIDGTKKMEIISEIRAAVGKQATLEELAAYLNISPSMISYFTDESSIAA